MNGYGAELSVAGMQLGMRLSESRVVEEIAVVEALPEHIEPVPTMVWDDAGKPQLDLFAGKLQIW